LKLLGKRQDDLNAKPFHTGPRQVRKGFRLAC